MELGGFLLAARGTDVSKWARKPSDSGASLFSLIHPQPFGPRAQHCLPSGTSPRALRSVVIRWGLRGGAAPRTCAARVDAPAPPSHRIQTDPSALLTLKADIVSLQ